VLFERPRGSAYNTVREYQPRLDDAIIQQVGRPRRIIIIAQQSRLQSEKHQNRGIPTLLGEGLLATKALHPREEPSANEPKYVRANQILTMPIADLPDWEFSEAASGILSWDCQIVR